MIKFILISCMLLFATSDVFARNCDSYVSAPCNEAAYSQCREELGRVFHCGGCEGIGPMILASCACENLQNKADRSSESMCKDVMTPEAIKAAFKKEMDSSKK